MTAAISSVITQLLLRPENALLAAGLSFSFFLVLQITLTGKRESSFPAESDSSLEFNTTSPNSKHIFLLLQFSACVMTVFLCCDSDSGRADEKKKTEEGNDVEYLLSILKKGDRNIWNQGIIDGG